MPESVGTGGEGDLLATLFDYADQTILLALQAKFIFLFFVCKCYIK